MPNKNTRLLCTVLGMKMEACRKEVLLLKNPFPKPFYKSKDGFGMLSHLEKLKQKMMLVIISERPDGVLIADWPESVPEEIRQIAILPSDLSPVHIYEGGAVKVESSN